MRRGPLACGALAVLALGFAELGFVPRSLLVNVSSSLPVGVYRLERSEPGRGSLVAVRLPAALHSVAVERSYLGARSLLLKPVAAMTGDWICRLGPMVTINGRLVAMARRVDHAGRGMSVWQGCRRLGADEVLVLAPHPGSFDGRYFGPLKRSRIVAVAVPIWTF